MHHGRTQRLLTGANQSAAQKSANGWKGSTAPVRRPHKLTLERACAVIGVASSRKSSSGISDRPSRRRPVESAPKTGHSQRLRQSAWRSPYRRSSTPGAYGRSTASVALRTIAPTPKRPLTWPTKANRPLQHRLLYAAATQVPGCTDDKAGQPEIRQLHLAAISDRSSRSLRWSAVRPACCYSMPITAQRSTTQ